MCDSVVRDGQAGAEIAIVGDRGVYAPDGLSPVAILAAAEVLEREFDVAPFISRMMARRVMQVERRATTG